MWSLLNDSECWNVIGSAKKITLNSKPWRGICGELFPTTSLRDMAFKICYAIFIQENMFIVCFCCLPSFMYARFRYIFPFICDRVYYACVCVRMCVRESLSCPFMAVCLAFIGSHTLSFALRTPTCKDVQIHSLFLYIRHFF